MVATMFQEDQMQLDRWVSDIDVSATSRAKIIRPWSRHASRPESTECFVASAKVSLRNCYINKERRYMYTSNCKMQHN